ncbi:MAG: hypothetical protein E6R03_03225 [Hyphomicrobiaceae bacterium]|nr:MAG: hypothetical protein E6R03_03225 [Hyphomicrobiaceae bacterium]
MTYTIEALWIIWLIVCAAAWLIGTIEFWAKVTNDAWWGFFCVIITAFGVPFIVVSILLDLGIITR